MTNIFLEKGTLRPKRRFIKKQTSKIDKSLLILTAILIVLGLVFTYSASAFDTMAYFKRQLFFDIVGVIIMFILAKYYTQLQEIIKPKIVLYLTWIGLIWALFSAETAHVHRWIHLGPINIQPSEFAKLALIIFLSYSLSKKQNIAENPKSLIAPLILTGITILLVVFGKDMGIPFLMFGISLMLFFIAGTRIRDIAFVFLITAPFGVIE